MLDDGFDVRVKVSEIIENQIPEFILSENENFSEFLKQYYISQEFQGGPSDLSENLDQYLKLDNLSSENISSSYTLTSDVFELDDEIFVSSTIGFPPKYGLLKINDEIITYTGITTTSFTGCIRGFSGIESYSNDGDIKNLVFKKTDISFHESGTNVENLSVLFLKEFYKKIKSYYTPGLEDIDFIPQLNIGNFIKQSKSLYQSKGTEESFRILFNVLYGVDPKIIDLEDYLLKPSTAEYKRRKVLFCRLISGNPFNLIGQRLVSSDGSASGPISEIEIINKNDEYFYKIYLFEGYDDKSLIDGEFKITPSSRVIGQVSEGSSTISVDSTVSFPKSGTLICGDNIIQYSDKSVNQFFNCSGITSVIENAQRIRANEYAYGYENGNEESIVYFEVCGVLSNLKIDSELKFLDIGERSIVSNFGDYIENNPTKSFKEFAFNSWIYNTSSRYEILSSNSNTTHIVKENLDKSSVKSGDSIDILLRGTDTIIASAEVANADGNNLSLINFINTSSYVGLSTLKIDFRRNLKYSTSNSIPLKYENILSNVQNTYNENDEYMYVATNSIPDYEIEKNILTISISEADSSRVNNNSIIFSLSKLPFITGDSIIYSSTVTPIGGLEDGKTYFVRVIGSSIRLYNSRSFVYTDNYIKLSPIDEIGSHSFSLKEQFAKTIVPSRSLRKFPLNPEVNTGKDIETIPGRSIGTLINGVDIVNYKGVDKVYYGPIQDKIIYNSGDNYDVVNPPLLEVSPSIGTTCLIQPVLRGNIVSILLDQKDAPVKDVKSITISGGNGSGAVLKPIIENRYREVEFNGRTGVSAINDAITFTQQHNFFDGQEIVYNSNGNNSIGIGSFGGSDTDQGKTLLNGGIYYAKPINSYSIFIYDNVNNYNNGINTVGFTTINNAGIHKFRSLASEKVLSDVKVISRGEGYTNRKLIVKPSDVSISYSNIIFTNHGFSDGELVTYTNIGTPISGISTENKYFILKIDENKFRLADAGLDGKVTSNYLSKKYVEFETVGDGYHIFNYPEIKVDINVSYADTTSSITATPIVRGKIEDLYIYENGSKYGSEILNYHKRPEITVKTGKNAAIRPVISNGKIVDVEVEATGSEYYSIPEVIVHGNGSGAKISVEINQGQIINASVIRTGIGYSSSSTTIEILSSGSGFIADLSVRDLVINNNYRFGDEFLNTRGPIGLSTDEVIYQILGYSDFIRESFKDNFGSETNPEHSPLIGWAYDGNPIYGPFGYSEPSNTNSVKLLSSSYVLEPSSIEDRPSFVNFPSGIFVDDYVFKNSGDLDKYNGRFAKTPDFPNGTYAYYAGIQTSLTVPDSYESVFPYFIGNYFKSTFLPEIVDLNQDFDFNNSNLIRNTFPYRTGQKYSRNEYIDFTYDEKTDFSVVEGVNSGSIDSFDIINSGQKYKIGDTIIINNEGSSGSGASAEVSEITGENVVSIQTDIESYTNAVLTKNNNSSLRIYTNSYHNLNTGEFISINNEYQDIGIQGIYEIEVNYSNSYLIKEIPASGIVTDIYVSNIPSYVSAGSSIGIGTEILSVLNIFEENKILRVKREFVGVSHTQSSLIEFYPNSFTIPVSSNQLKIESEINERVYFNPTKSIGVGTEVGVSTTLLYPLGELNIPISVPTQSIYLPNHPFKTNDFVLMRGSSLISVANSSTVTPEFNILDSGSEYVYVINKSKDYIGIVTSVGLTTESNGLFFLDNGTDNYEFYFESLKNQVYLDFDKIDTVVSISTDHNLTSGDLINLNVVPNISVGIGTSSSIKVIYDSDIERLTINPQVATVSLSSGMSARPPALTDEVYSHIINNYDVIDIDGDGLITEVETKIIQKYVAGSSDYSDITFPEGATRTSNTDINNYVGLHTMGGTGILDITRNGTISSLDASRLAQFISFYNFGSKFIFSSDHNLKTGDKVLFEGTEKKTLYVYKVSNTVIKLCDTFYDCFTNPPSFSQTIPYDTENIISLINPPIDVVYNNNLVFDLSDSSLSGKELKFFYDNNFRNEFVSSSSTKQFNIIGIGTVGISTEAKVTLNSYGDINFDLYYTLKDSEGILDADEDVKNYSRITYKNSDYNGSYKIINLNETEFKINLAKIPERVSYSSTETDSLSYTTNSRTSSGGIVKLRKVFGGIGYKKVPEFIGFASSEGFGATVELKSTSIGRPSEILINNSGYVYPSDKTLKPISQFPYILNLSNNQEVSNIAVTDGGENYFAPPLLVVVNSITRELIDNGAINPIMGSGSIVGVEIISPPKGLSSVKHEVYSINNSNGVGINSISVSNSGIVTCALNTPLNGFSTTNPPFSEGDEIFVEGIENISGNGFNSTDYGYVFFKVKKYTPTNPAVLEYEISDYTSSVGIAKTFQTFAYITNKNNYPKFTVSQSNSKFSDGEILYLNNGGGFYETDLKISSSINNYIKVVGKDSLLKESIILGKKSGSIAKIQTILKNDGEYEVDSTYSSNNGWKNEVGVLSIDNQVTPDNDYYQNLSYSVKSPITFEEMIDPVNRMLHTVGLKNFADVGISSSVSVGIGSTSVSTLLVDFIEDIRVDTLNRYDLVLDFDASEERSKFIKFQNKKLSDYFKCKTNRVLEIDDISNRFSSKTFTQESYLNLVNYPRYLNYSRFLVQTVGINTNEYQLDDIVVLNDNFNSYTVNRGSLINDPLEYNTSEYVEIYGNLDEFFNLSLRFSPKKFENNSYSVKTFTNYFNTSLTGIGTTSLGFVSLSSKTQQVLPGITTQISGFETSNCNGFISEVLVYDSIGNNINFFEIAVDHDGTNSYISEYYFDTREYDGYSATPIGSFGTSINEGILEFTFDNYSNNNVIIKSKITNFETPSVGISTIRFKSEDQPDGSERSCRLEAKHSIVSAASTIISVDASTVTSFRSLIKIKNNENTSLHQVLFLNALTETYILPKYYVSIGNTSGIGTFGSEYDGTEAILKFYPDPSFSGTFEISSYSEILYTDLDFDNEIIDLEYGTVVETINNGRYNSINGEGNDQLEFDLKYKDSPIFQKTFNPTLQTTLNPSTGEFTIKDHFFSPNEELIYKEGSTFIGVGASPMGIGATICGGEAFLGDIILGFSTITGISDSTLLQVDQIVFGPNIPDGTTIVSIGQTYQYFIGNVVSGGSTVITGIANTDVLEIGAGIFSGDGTSLGTVQTIGINSITSNVTISSGNDILYYTDNIGVAVSLSNVSTASTFRQQFNSGIVTDICPSTVYVIKIDADKFKLTGTKGSGIGFTFTNYGEGNAHTLTMVKRNEKSLITVDGIVQYPILYTPISHTLDQSIGIFDDHFRLSGISSINPKDLLKIGNEYVGVINVGLGTTSTGPVSGVGTETIVYVDRGFVGTSATNHDKGDTVQVYRGSYNIVDSKIFFTEAPKGTGSNEGKNNSNLDLPKSSFSGRVFLRNNYSSNIIYDEFSDSFSGIGKTYEIKYRGQDVNYIEPGSGILFINQIFQTPTTENNQGNNYELVSVGSTTNIVFSGINNPIDNLPYTSEDDVNQNQLPRGGIIISLGSTSGLGFAPLVGASVTAVVSGGVIQSVGLSSADVIGSGYRGVVSIGVTDITGSGAEIAASVGAGGTLSFNVLHGGSGYSSNPVIQVPEPSYENLPIIGVSRLGIGSTTQTGIGLSITVDVGPVSTTGIGSTLFEVKTFNISKLGYGFKRGDVFKPVGLVTDRNLTSIIEDFELTVLETFNDSSALWQFGELDYIDSISNLQDGSRTRFPLYRNNELLSFEIDETDPDSRLIEFNSLLIIFINGVLQKPGLSYEFNGGTSFILSDPPKPEDNVDVFFYRGTRNVDSFLEDITEFLKIGDSVQIKSNSDYPKTIDQDSRLVFEILKSDLIETNVYLGSGIDSVNPKPIDIIPQKTDKIINTNKISKSRDSLSSLVFPTAKIIKDVLSNDSQIFVDDAESFNYEELNLGSSIIEFDSIIVEGSDKIFANIESVVSTSSTIILNIIDGGSGYNPGTVVDLSISNPFDLNTGILAEATANVSSAGTISSINITNPGFGYINPPQVIVPLPTTKIETIENIQFVQGFSGIVTGITETTGIGTDYALKFYLHKESGTFDALLVNYPILIVDTNVGSGVTSIDTDDNSVVGIGTTFLDNIYYIHSITRDGSNSEIICNVKSDSNITGISTSGTNIGRFSWGRISSLERLSPKEFIVSGNIVSSGLSTYPQIQRRNYGLRSTGSFSK